MAKDTLEQRERFSLSFCFEFPLAHAIGRWMMRLTGSNETGILVITMITVAVLSAFMSSVGATAVLIPVVMSIAWEARVNPSRLLLPLAFASLIGGIAIPPPRSCALATRS